MVHLDRKENPEVEGQIGLEEEDQMDHLDHQINPLGRDLDRRILLDLQTLLDLQIHLGRNRDQTLDRRIHPGHQIHLDHHPMGHLPHAHLNRRKKPGPLL